MQQKNIYDIYIYLSLKGIKYTMAHFDVIILSFLAFFILTSVFLILFYIKKIKLKVKLYNEEVAHHNEIFSDRPSEQKKFINFKEHLSRSIKYEFKLFVLRLYYGIRYQLKDDVIKITNITRFFYVLIVPLVLLLLYIGFFIEIFEGVPLKHFSLEFFREIQILTVDYIIGYILLIMASILIYGIRVAPILSFFIILNGIILIPYILPKYVITHILHHIIDINTAWKFDIGHYLLVVLIPSTFIFIAFNILISKAEKQSFDSIYDFNRIQKFFDEFTLRNIKV